MDNWFYFDFNKDAIFKNPQADLAENFTMSFSQKDSNPPVLPYFISAYPNGTLYGIGNLQDIGTYTIECLGKNEAGWKSTIDFTITVLRNSITF